MRNESILSLRQRLGRPLVMGHRGAMGYCPENTLSSFEKGFDLGCDAVELDVHLSADAHLVVLHDDTVDRTTNGKGAVEALSLAELKALDAGSHFDQAYAGERIPTLEEVLNWAQGRLPVVIEVKIGRNWEAIVNALIDLVDRLDAGNRVAFISFDHFIVRGLKKRRPHWEVGALYLARVVDPVGLAGAALANGLLPNIGYLTPDLVEQAHQEGLWVGTWTANTEAEIAHAIAMGADVIGCNYPDRLIKALKK